jgi:polysaccharide biosynthesis transport protein
MSLNDSLQILRRRKWLVLAVIVAITAAAVAYSLTQKPSYRATAQVLLSQQNVVATLSGAPDATSTQDPGRYVSTQAELTRVPAVARAAIRIAGVPISLDSFLSSSSVTSSPDADLLEFQVDSGSPQRAQRLVNAYARAFTRYREALDTRSLRRAQRDVTDRLRTLRASGDQTSALYRRLTAKKEELRVSQALQTSHAIVVRTADDATKTRPKPVRNGVVAFVLALFLGVGLAFVRDALSDQDELEESFGLPVLGTIPDSKALAKDGRSEELPPLESEAFRMLRGRLRHFDGDQKVSSVLVTSGVARDGKSTVAWNLALTSASVGSKTILLECDFHQPTLATRRGLRPVPGLSELLTGQTDLVVQHISVANSSNGEEPDRQLDVVVAGTRPPNPVELTESDEMAALIEHLTTDEYDLVVIDTPPITLVSDVIPLVRLVSGVIVVGEPGRTKRESATALREQLESLDAPVLGLVANRVKTRSGYGYAYYHHDEVAGLRIGDRS